MNNVVGSVVKDGDIVSDFQLLGWDLFDGLSVIAIDGRKRDDDGLDDGPKGDDDGDLDGAVDNDVIDDGITDCNCDGI
jgi:hypothetical protein